MHPATLFHQTDEVALSALVADHPFALIMGVVDGKPAAVHAPVLLEARRLRFHLSRSSVLVPAFADGGAVLAVVTGPHAYISPDWYGQDDQVGTWNYLSVEMAGPARMLDAAGTTALLDDLSAKFEAGLAPKKPWTRDKMTPGRFEALLGGIVAYEVMIERFEGTWKLGQNKPPEALAGVVAGLKSAGGTAVAALTEALL